MTLAPPSSALAQTSAPVNLSAIDLFAGTGWGVSCQQLGIPEQGIEIMPEARASREAAGMTTIYEDVWDALAHAPLDSPEFAAALEIASPPCQTFSVAGRGSGRLALDNVLALIASRAWELPGDGLRRVTLEHGLDDRTALVLTPLAYAYRHRPTYIVLEQVPTVLPVWLAVADVLRELGYSVATGVLNAEQYGVPQTRRRAILTARRDGVTAALPTPTHSRYYSRDPKRLDEGVLPWVSMADALGWGMTERPYFTIAAGTASGGVDPAYIGGSGARAQMMRELDSGRWRYRSNYSTTARDGLTAPEGSRLPRTERPLDHPAPTITGKRAAWTDGDRVVRLTDQEAAALQTYPADFPFQGARGPVAQQIGNAVPPLLGRAILAAAVAT